MGGHALGGIAHAGARADAEIHRARRERLLQLPVALECRDLHVEADGLPIPCSCASSMPANGNDVTTALPMRTV